MAVTAWRQCGTVTPTNGLDGASSTWVNPNNVKVEDGSDASIKTLYFGSTPFGDPQYLYCTNFGFTSTHVPSGATIEGIEFRYKRKGETTTSSKTNAVNALKGTPSVPPSSANQADSAFWSTSYETITIGGAADLLGLTWTQPDVIATTFGISIQAQLLAGGPSGTDRNGYIDVIEARVHYSSGIVHSGQAALTGTAGIAALGKATYKGAASLTGTGSASPLAKVVIRGRAKLMAGGPVAKAQTAASAHYYLDDGPNTVIPATGDWCICAWFRLDSKAVDSNITGKYSATTNGEVKIQYVQSTDRIRLQVTDNAGGVTSLNDNVLLSPTVGVWYFVCAWKDSAGGRYCISTNASATAPTQSTTLRTIVDTSLAIGFGAQHNSNTTRLIGALGPIFYYNTRFLNLAEREELYNNGFPIPFYEMTTAQKLGLMCFFSPNVSEDESPIDPITGRTITLSATGSWKSVSMPSTRGKVTATAYSSTEQRGAASLAATATVNAVPTEILTIRGEALLSATAGMVAGARAIYSGRMTSTGAVAVAAVATLPKDGVTNLTAKATVKARRTRIRISRPLTMTPKATIYAVPHPFKLGASELGASATVTAAGQRVQQAGVLFGAKAHLAALGNVSTPGAASLNTSAALTASGVLVPRSPATLACTASLTATARRETKGAAILPATATTSAVWRNIKRGVAALKAKATISRASEAGRTSGAASMAGTGSVSAKGTRVLLGAANLTGIASLYASERRPVSMSASAALAARASVLVRGASALTASASVTANNRRIQEAEAVIEVIAAMTAIGSGGTTPESGDSGVNRRLLILARRR